MRSFLLHKNIIGFKQCPDVALKTKTRIGLFNENTHRVEEEVGYVLLVRYSWPVYLILLPRWMKKCVCSSKTTFSAA